MTRTTPPQRSFSSGEVDPLLVQRTDYERLGTGLAKCNGFLPLVQGGFTRAPGTIYLGTPRANVPTVLVPFVFAADDACILEFTNGKMRVWRYGALVTVAGVPYEISSPYAASDLPNLRWQQTADVVYLVDGKHRPYQLSRLALDNWTLTVETFNNGPFRVENTDSAVTVTTFVWFPGEVQLQSSSPIFDPGHVDSLFWISPTDQATVPLWTQNEATPLNDLRRYDDKIYKLTQRTPANVGATPPTHDTGTVAVMDGVKWQYISDLDGIVRITAVTDSTHATATILRYVPDDCYAAATPRWAFGAWSTLYGYPSAVTLYDQRIVFAASTAEPRSIWFSTAGDFNDWFPGVDADRAFAFTVSGDGSINRILNLKTGRAGLHVLALGQEFSTRSESRTQVIGPTNAVFGLDSSIGSSPAASITPYGSPIFISRDKARVVQISYNFETNSNEAQILSRPSQHLGAKGFEEIEWVSAPQPMALVRRSTGDLAVMTYEPNENVLGWATLSIAGGRVESLAVTPDPVDGTDVITAVVRRTFGTSLRTIEQFSPWYGILTGDLTAAEAQHLYCATTTVPGSPTASFSVPHLAGQSVYAWTDLGAFGPYVVPVGGAITLPEAVSRCHIGLFDATHQVETLDIQAAAPDGASQGRKKRLTHRQTVALHATVQGQVEGVTRVLAQDDVVTLRQNLVPVQVAAMPHTAFTGLAVLDLQTDTADQAALRFWPVSGAPMTVTAIVPKVQEGGA